MKVYIIGVGLIGGSIAKDLINLIDYCRWPPAGKRGVGFSRANLFGEYFSDYYQEAQSPLIIAMIETKMGIYNLDEILSVPNLTGVYIGPADMSISFGAKPQFDVKEDPVYSNIELILKKTKEHGKIAGIQNGTTKYAKEMIDLGFQLVTISSDFRSMNSYAQNIVNDMKKLDNKEFKSESY